MKKNELIVGNVYVTTAKSSGEYRYVFKYTGSYTESTYYLNRKNPTFGTCSTSTLTGNSYRLSEPTKDDIEHYKQCVNAKKFVDYEPKAVELYPIF